MSVRSKVLSSSKSMLTKYLKNIGVEGRPVIHWTRTLTYCHPALAPEGFDGGAQDPTRGPGSPVYRGRAGGRETSPGFSREPGPAAPGLPGNRPAG